MRIITATAAALALTCATSAHAAGVGNYESPIFAVIDWGVRTIIGFF